jgi:hypothetical protein
MALYKRGQPGHRVTDKDIKTVFDTQRDTAMRRTVQAAEDARLLLAGENAIEVHANLAKLGIRKPIRLAQARTASQRLLQALTEKTPEIKRFWSGLAKAAQERSTAIEQPIDAVMRSKGMYPRFDVCDNLLNESWCAVSVVPAMADWLRTPILMTSDGQIQKQYRKFAKTDEEAIAAFEDAKAGHLMRHLPFRMSAHSIRQSGPVFGHNGKLVALTTKRSLNSIEAINAGYLWGDGYLCQESDEVLNRAGDLDFYEFLGTGADGHVYISYSIDGYQTTRQDLGDGAAVIDLTDKYGIERCPIASDWGLGWGSVDPDLRGMTFTGPFAESWNGAERILTYLMAACMWLGLPVLMEEPTEFSEDEGDEPKPTMIEPGAIHRARGKMSQLQVTPFSPGMVQMLSMLMGTNESELPSKQGLGGGGDNAIAQTVSRAFAEDAVGSVRRADLALYEQAASFAWEQGVCIGRKFHPVQVLANINTLIPTTGRTSSTQQPLTIDPDLVPEDLSTADFELHAILPGDPSDNMPLIMMLAELNDRQKYPLEDLLERMGFSAPEQVVAKIEAEGLRKLPAYQAMQLRRIAQVAGNDEEAEFYRLQADQLMAEIIGINGEAVIGPDGNPVRLPTGVGQGLQRVGGPMTGTAQSNPVQSALASHVGSAGRGAATGLARRTAEAGGQMPSSAPASSQAA